jgi:hypothetical protein
VAQPALKDLETILAILDLEPVRCQGTESGLSTGAEGIEVSLTESRDWRHLHRIVSSIGIEIFFNGVSSR